MVKGDILLIGIGIKFHEGFNEIHTDNNTNGKCAKTIKLTTEMDETSLSSFLFGSHCNSTLRKI